MNQLLYDDEELAQMLADEELAYSLSYGRENKFGYEVKDFEFDDAKYAQMLADEELAHRLSQMIIAPIIDQKLGEIIETTDTFYRFYCPHGCGVLIEVPKDQINCTIFRCGEDDNGKQIGQHITEEQASALKLDRGCSRQFRMIRTGSTYKIEKCTGF